MYARARYVVTALLVLLFSMSAAFAQQSAPQQGRRGFAQQELDQMLAPIALYPDALLSQILMAATYPVEVVEAARWSRGNSGLAGDRAVRAAERMDWDPSVKSLVAFPQILDMMDAKLEWTEDLGDAFLDQQAQVMDTVQYLRDKAYAAGNLRSNDQYRVDYEGSTFSITLANPEMVYLPYYNPLIVYGAWWWPTHQPVYWTAWPGYYSRPGYSRAFAWGPAIPVSRGFFYSAPDWHRRSVNIVNVNTYYYRPAQVNRQAEFPRNANVAGSPAGHWQHDTAHRREAPYRDASSRPQAGHSGAAPEVRQDRRAWGQPAAGQPAVDGRGGLGNRQDARVDSGNRREERGTPQPVVASIGGARPNVERAPVSTMPPAAVRQPEVRSALSQPNPPVTVSRPNAEQRPGNGHAAAGGAQRAEPRNAAAREHAREHAGQQVAASNDNSAATSVASSAANAAPAAGNSRGGGGPYRH